MNDSRPHEYSRLISHNAALRNVRGRRREWRVSFTASIQNGVHRERAKPLARTIFHRLPCLVLAANRVIRTRAELRHRHWPLTFLFRARERGFLASPLALIRTIIALVVIILRYIIAAYTLV